MELSSWIDDRRVLRSSSAYDGADILSGSLDSTSQLLELLPELLLLG